MSKKLLSVTLSCILLLSLCFTNVYADPGEIELEEFLGELVSIEYFDNGDSFAVYISDVDDATFSSSSSNSVNGVNFITKAKTGYYRDSNGGVLWSVTIQATFWYNGTLSACTGYVPSAVSSSSYWTISSVTGYKVGNTATATATAVHKVGSASETVSRSIIIGCSPTGVIS